MSHQDPTPETIKAGRHYVIATDGSCIGNPGPGGWAFVKQLWQGDQLLQQAPFLGHSGNGAATNNRMELMAAIKAVDGIRESETPAVIRTDANYVLKGMTEWLPNWKAKNWRSSKGLVENRDLWERLDAACAAKTVYWEKVKGHSGDHLNEIADTLAEGAARGWYPNGWRSVKDRHPTWFINV